MGTNFFENRKTGIILAVIAFLLLLTGGFFVIKSNSLKKQLRDSVAQTEELTSENLLLKKTNGKLSDDLKIQQDQIAQLTDGLNLANQKITEQDAVIKRLRGQQSNSAMLSKKIEGLELEKAELEKQIAGLNESLQQLNLKNSELTASLGEQKKKTEMLAQNNKVLLAMEGNNFLTEALRGKKDKLTAWAMCTRKLVVNLDVPAEAAQNIEFRVKTPAGKQFSSETDKNLTVDVPAGQKANNLVINQESVPMSPVVLTFNREEKLVKGIYLFDIYNNGQYAGTNQVRIK